jgi:hypothetical protein
MLLEAPELPLELVAVGVHGIDIAAENGYGHASRREDFLYPPGESRAQVPRRGGDAWKGFRRGELDGVWAKGLDPFGQDFCRKTSEIVRAQSELQHALTVSGFAACRKSFLSAERFASNAFC